MGSSDLAHRMANAIRGLSMDGVEKAKSGHPGLPMGAADIATVIYTKFLKFDPTDTHWADRDRFILSAGHGSMLLYSILYLTGTTGMTMDELKNFRQSGSKTPGHPEVGHTPGVEMTTGPLGQGLATSVASRLPSVISTPNSPPILLIIIPMCWHPMATLWKVFRRKPSRLRAI